MAYPYSTKRWILVNILFPLSPVFLKGIIRFVASDLVLEWDTFDATTMSMCIALLCWFVSQSLSLHSFPLQDEEAEAETKVKAEGFKIYAFIAIMLFALLAYLTKYIELHPDSSVNLHLRVWECVVFIGWIIPVRSAIAAHLTYKLKVSV